MIRNIDSSGFRIFILAIAASIMVHIFWISAVKITTSPSGVGRVKFSKVSFLGPASVQSTLPEFKVAPQSASFLEKRLRQKILDMPVPGIGGANVFYGRGEGKDIPAHQNDNAMAPFIKEALE